MRIQGWQQALWARFDEARLLKFDWGTHDCVMFATSCIDVIAGTDYYAQAKVRYPYSTQAEAVALMQQWDGITGLVASFLGDQVNWGQLTTGDIVLVAPIPLMTDMEMLCVHDGVGLVGPHVNGLTKIPLMYAVHGWAIR